MYRRFIYIIAISLAILNFAGCHSSVLVTKNDVSNTAVKLDAGEMVEQNEDISSYNDPDALAYWQHFVFELYRDAEENSGFETLDYSHVFKRNEEMYMQVNLSYPFLQETTAFARAINHYYTSRQNSVIADAEAEKEPFSSMEVYEEKVLCAYEWGGVYSVVIEKTESAMRSFSTPICDNFNLITGELLAMRDIFCVDYNEFSARICEVLRNLDGSTIELRLFPFYEDGSESIPLPRSETFLLTPKGLALFYQQGEIADMAQGVVILYVEYTDISDILNLPV